MSRLVVIVLGLCAHLIPVLATAQLREFDITPVQSNRIPVFRDHPEMAAVIVNSSLTNLRFDSNLEIVAMLGNPNQGEYILIVRPNRQIITVNAPGFQQGRVTIAPTEPRQVLYYRVEPKEVVLSTLPVTIRVNPPDARVTIDGQPADLTRPVPLEPGTHAVRIERDGFRTIDREITAAPDRILFEFALERVQMVLVRIVTVPGNAIVTVDGADAGRSDALGVLELFRFPGQYRVGASLSGYLSAEQTLLVRETGTNEARITLERNSGTLNLRVTPADAEVRVNRQVVNTSQPLNLPPGPQRIEISAEFHDPYVEDVTIIRNQTLERTVVLTSHRGSLLLSVSPSTASSILLDAAGRQVQTWTGSRSFPDLQAGRYSVHVSAEGYEPQTVPVTIRKDEPTQQRVELLTGSAPIAAPSVGPLPCGSPITDIDGNTYKTVQIGNQCWMAENLRTSKYRDGTPIPNITANRDWSRLTTGAWAHYENQAANETRYGKLYNWHAVADRRNVCPTGWHVPSDAEWTVLSNHLGSEPGHKMKATSGWNNRGNGSNASGFNGLPGGLRFSDGTFFFVGSSGYFWSSSENNSGLAWGRNLTNGARDLSRSNKFGKRSGFSVRCLRD